MTAALPTPNTSDYSSNGLQSYRGAASYLVQNEQLNQEQGPCEPSRACGSPPRFRPNSARCRSRTPSPPQTSREGSSSCSKAPRSVSPGGTPSSSAGAALRQGQTSQGRRVRWANTLVSSVRTRPRTLRKDVASLFYSRADEKRFRKEAEAAPSHDEWCEQLEEDSLTALSDDDEEDGDHVSLWSPQRKDFTISKAKVTYGGATETYGGGGCAIEAAREAEMVANLFSFDNESFWNGQLTWS